MREAELKPEEVPLLFPDPVIEYYLARVDRAAIRAQLKKTPAERLEWLQEKMNREGSDNQMAREGTPPWPGRKSKIDLGVDPAWFAAAEAVPILFPDPVIESYLEDVDRGLLRANLQLTVAERLDQFANFMNGIYELRGAALKDKSGLWEEYPFEHA